MFTGYELTEQSRNMLLSAFKPAYSRVIAHHITYEYGVSKDALPPEMPKICEVVGYIKENGVEGLLISIDGSVKRPDGSKYHITWSLDTGHKPVETNNYVDNATPINPPIKIDVIPKNFWNT